MSITNPMEKINQFIQSERGKDILTVVIVILVGTGSFELGRLSKENQSSGIKIEYPDQGTNLASNVISAADTVNGTIDRGVSKTVAITKAGKTFFASNRGSKYYSIGCSAGKTIKQENRVYFATKEEAERAGYQLSSSCK